MYFFVIRQLNGLNAGIQCGHAVEQYAHKYKDDPEYIDFVKNWKTWIVLNGGTTNNRRDFKVGEEYLSSETIAIGTLNQIYDQLLDHEINFSYFEEPDLNDALTAVCFICDERVFNKELYPDFVDFMFNKMYPAARQNIPYENEKWIRSLQNTQELFPEYYTEWVESLGGEKNVFLRNLIKDKKLA